MRQTLSQEENDTAVALLELQLQKIPGVTIEDLTEYLQKDQKIIREHLDKFMADALLDFRESQGKIYYYAP
jgi:predicted ArsR family transcriptional regulator